MARIREQGPASAARRKSHVASELARAFRSHRAAFAATAVFSFFINLLMLTGPLFMLQIYDRVLPSRSLPTLFALFGLMTLMFIIVGLLEWIRSRVLVRIGMRLDRQLSDRLFDAEVRRNLLAGGGKGVAALRELDVLRQFMTGPGPFALFDSPWVPVYIAVVFLFHWTLGVLAVVGALCLFVVAILNDIRTRRPIEEGAVAQWSSGRLSEAGQRNAQVLSSMGMLPSYRALWKREHDDALVSQAVASDRAGSLTAVSKAFRLFLQSAMLGAGAWLAVDQIITPGVMIAASIILSRALQPIEQSISQWRGFVRARRAYRLLEGLLDAVPQAAEKTILTEPRGALKVMRLGATVPGSERTILKGERLSFALQPGQTLGVIGPSGSGKSTMAKAIMGVWPREATTGQIEIDGTPIWQWDTLQLGSNVGYLPQDVELFPGTVKANIARFDPDMDDAKVVEAARLAGVDKMVLDLPHGFETDIGHMGASLSAGQAQRIGLARALYGNPALIVLDEPNSNLDRLGELALENAISRMRDMGRTVVVISHRAEALQTIDFLMLITNGDMAMFGPRDRVVAELRAMQAKMAASPNPVAGFGRPAGASEDGRTVVTEAG